MARFTEALAQPRHIGAVCPHRSTGSRGTHPEFHHVRRIFDALNEKIKAEGTNRPDLAAEFSELRKITQDYTVPGDVCETYAAVYNMLAELDEAYHA